MLSRSREDVPGRRPARITRKYESKGTRDHNDVESEAESSYEDSSQAGETSGSQHSSGPDSPRGGITNEAGSRTLRKRNRRSESPTSDDTFVPDSDIASEASSSPRKHNRGSKSHNSGKRTRSRSGHLSDAGPSVQKKPKGKRVGRGPYSARIDTSDMDSSGVHLISRFKEVRDIREFQREELGDACDTQTATSRDSELESAAILRPSEPETAAVPRPSEPHSREPEAATMPRDSEPESAVIPRPFEPEAAAMLPDFDPESATEPRESQPETETEPHNPHTLTTPPFLDQNAKEMIFNVAANALYIINHAGAVTRADAENPLGFVMKRRQDPYVIQNAVEDIIRRQREIHDRNQGTPSTNTASGYFEAVLEHSIAIVLKNLWITPLPPNGSSEVSYSGVFTFFDTLARTQFGADEFKVTRNQQSQGIVEGTRLDMYIERKGKGVIYCEEKADIIQGLVYALKDLAKKVTSCGRQWHLVCAGSRMMFRYVNVTYNGTDFEIEMLEKFFFEMDDNNQPKRIGGAHLFFEILCASRFD